MRKALVIEDNLDWQARIREILEDEGFSVSAVGTEEKAREVLTSIGDKDDGFLLISLDLRLDELSDKFEGMDLLNLTTKHWEKFGTRLVIITGYGWVDKYQEAIEKYPQIYDFITKYKKDHEFSEYFRKRVQEIRLENI